MPLLKVVATFAIIVVGLILLRWVAAVTVAPAAPAAARSSSASGDLPSIRTAATLEPLADPTDTIDLLAAYDEAMRLARESVADDDLETARDLYFLATEALPGDPEAAARVRQVETVLGIEDRTTDWREALDEVEDLMTLGPQAPTIMRAYTEALVGAGREALTSGNALRAQRLCGEASQRAPARNDARLCAIQAAATMTAIAGPPSVTLTPPTPTNTPAPSPSATPPPPATPTSSPTPLASAAPVALDTPAPTDAPPPVETPTPAEDQPAPDAALLSGTPSPSVTPRPSTTPLIVIDRP